MGFSKNQLLDESLSALMDNEASEMELRRLLKQLSTENPDIQARWQRYHIARSALHGEPIVNSNPTSTTRILAAIASEPSFKSQPGQSQPGLPGKSQVAGPAANSWLHHAARLAIAASVTLTVFLGLKAWLIQDFSSTTGNLEVATERSNQEERGMVVVDTDAQHRLNEYIQRVSIQYSNEPGATSTSLFEEFPLLVPVNQIEAIDTGNR